MVNRAQEYLKDESWWKVDENCTIKMQFNIFAKGNSAKNIFALSLFGKRIPFEKNPKCLGISLDGCFNFYSQIKAIKSKCSARLHIIKI